MSEVANKGDALQILLDTSQLAQELFDAIEADGLEVDRPTLVRLAELEARVCALRRALTLRYALSGRHADDFLAAVRESLQAEMDE